MTARRTGEFALEIKAVTDDVLVLQDPSRRVAGWTVVAASLLWTAVVVPRAVVQNGLPVGLVALAGAGWIASPSVRKDDA